MLIEPRKDSSKSHGYRQICSSSSERPLLGFAVDDAEWLDRPAFDNREREPVFPRYTRELRNSHGVGSAPSLGWIIEIFQ